MFKKKYHNRQSQLSLVSEKELEQNIGNTIQLIPSKVKIVSSSTPAKMQKWFNGLEQGLPARLPHITIQRDVTNELKDYKWEFNLVDSQEVNAMVHARRERLLFITGILPVTQKKQHWQ
jgi:hypothetical protein